MEIGRWIYTWTLNHTKGGNVVMRVRIMYSCLKTTKNILARLKPNVNVKRLTLLKIMHSD